jgi:hypothetical protein
MRIVKLEARNPKLERLSYFQNSKLTKESIIKKTDIPENLPSPLFAKLILTHKWGRWTRGLS